MREKSLIRRTALALLLASTVAVGLSACDPATPEPTKTSTPAPTTTSEPTETDPTSEWNADTTELEKAQSLFPKAEATKSHTKDEVQLALYGAWVYTQHAYNDTYLVNGSWFADGLPESYIADSYSKYFDLSYSGYITQKITEAKTDGKYDVLYGAFLLSDLRTGTLTAPASCADKEASQSCLNSDGLKFPDGWEYSEGADGGINVIVKIVAKPQYDKATANGTTLGEVEFTYNNTFTMVSNPYASPEAAIPSYVIVGIAGDWENTPWEPAQ